jgi:hypothetical protein
MTRRVLLASPLAVFLAGLGCGGPMSGGGGDAAGDTITISGMSFSPTMLAVAPGTTVTVHNMDMTPHSVTSEAATGAFTPGMSGGIGFDTGPFTGDATIIIPMTATVGTVVPYYSSTDGSKMTTPNGAIQIVDVMSMPMGMPSM